MSDEHEEIRRYVRDVEAYVGELEGKVGEIYSKRLGEQINHLFTKLAELEQINFKDKIEIAREIVNLESVLKDLANGLRLSHSIGDDRYYRIFEKLGEGNKE